MILEYGNPTTVSIDYTTGKTMMFSDHTDETDICAMIGEELEAYDKITVMLSGGLDSQFSAAVAKKYHENVHAIIFDFTWQGTTINSQDVYNAIKLAQKLDLSYEVIEHEIYDFLENDLVDFSRTFKSVSPQVSVHLNAIQKHAPTDGAILLGGDIPFIGMCDGIAICPHVPEKSIQHKAVFDSTMHIRSTGPYSLLGKELGATVIKNPFMLTPVILYASLRHNIDVIKDNNMVFNMSKNTLQKSSVNYKKAYYNSFGLDLLPPFIKRTGFESLRMHLASETGMYDEFNTRYRRPLALISAEEKWFGPVLTKGTHIEVEGDFRSVLEEIQDFCNENDVKESNTYEIDW